jgi:hypothetical protein
MKKFTKALSIVITILAFNVAFITTTFADTPPPPGHSQTGNQTPSGGGTAIGGGAIILALLGAGYGARKWYVNHKRKLDE